MVVNEPDFLGRLEHTRIIHIGTFVVGFVIASFERVKISGNVRQIRGTELDEMMVSTMFFMDHSPKNLHSFPLAEKVSGSDLREMVLTYAAKN